MTAISIFAPAKLNLFLAVTGRRQDGFHDLVSLAATLDFGDVLRVEATDADGGFELTCDRADLPLDESNLVLKAAKLFAEATGKRNGAKFFLEKKIPTGAGLGGGSSDGVAALRALNTLAGEPLRFSQMSDLAARLGSDCPLFLADGPVVMRGRGERIEAVAEKASARLRGRRVLIFKPDFEISTAWAYAQMTLRPESYCPTGEAESRIATWLANDRALVEEFLFNNMELVAGTKYLALPTMLERLRTNFALAPRMSGSGSACFAFLPKGAPVERIIAAIRDGWGHSAFVVQARLR